MRYKSRTHNKGFLKFLSFFANQRSPYGTTDQHRAQLSMSLKNGLKRKGR